MLRPGKSANGYQCITKCFPPLTKVKHPITKDIITSKKPFCAVNPYLTGKDKKQFDTCVPAFMPDDIIEDLGIREEKDFLDHIYNISDYSKFLDTLSTYNKINKITLQRIIRLGFIRFREKVKEKDFLLIGIFQQILNYYFPKYADKIKTTNHVSELLSQIIEKMNQEEFSLLLIKKLLKTS